MLSSNDKRKSFTISSNNRYSMVLNSSKDLSNDLSKEIFENEIKERTYLPEIWTDSKRLSVLFTEFRSREANPEGWDSKMMFWINSINRWSKERLVIKFNIEKIRSAFERNSTLPQVKCIQLVLSEMKRRKLIVSKEEFFKEIDNCQNQSWAKWGLNMLVYKPFSMVSSILVSDNDDSISEEMDYKITTEIEFINLQTLQWISNEIDSIGKDSIDNVVTFDDFYAQCNEKLNIDIESFELAILQLQYENKLKYIVDNKIKLIKFGPNAVFTEYDLGTMRLDAAKAILEKEIQKLEDEMEKCKDEARIAVREKNTNKAKSILRRKKRLENKIIEKETQMDNIDVLLEQIINAKSHKQVLQAFQKASDALRATQINENDAETIITDVEDTLELVSNINADISTPLATIDVDVEEELENLLNDVDQSQRAQKSKRDENELQNILDQLEVVKQSPTSSSSSSDKQRFKSQPLLS